jgi:hypothetical protein
MRVRLLRRCELQPAPLPCACGGDGPPSLLPLPALACSGARLHSVLARGDAWAEVLRMPLGFSGGGSSVLGRALEGRLQELRGDRTWAKVLLTGSSSSSSSPPAPTPTSPPSASHSAGIATSGAAPPAETRSARRGLEETKAAPRPDLASKDRGDGGRPLPSASTLSPSPLKLPTAMPVPMRGLPPALLHPLSESRASCVEQRLQVKQVWLTSTAACQRLTESLGPAARRTPRVAQKLARAPSLSCIPAYAPASASPGLPEAPPKTSQRRARPRLRPRPCRLVPLA